MKKKIRHLISRIKLIRINNHIKKAKRKGLAIGRNYTIFTRINFGSEPYLITIGDNVCLAPGVLFITHDGGVNVLNKIDGGKRDLFGRITIGNNVFIGANSILMPGVTIGNNVVIGSGSIVTKDIPSNFVAAGVPARLLKTIDEYREKNDPKCVQTRGMSFREKRKYVLNSFKDSNK